MLLDLRRAARSDAMGQGTAMHGYHDYTQGWAGQLCAAHALLRGPKFERAPTTSPHPLDLTPLRHAPRLTSPLGMRGAEVSIWPGIGLAMLVTTLRLLAA